jgi:hypothetical protein
MPMSAYDAIVWRSFIVSMRVHRGQSVNTPTPAMKFNRVGL